MKILVTGATGFVGGHLCQALEEAGHQLIPLCRSEKKYKALNLKSQALIGDLSSESQKKWITEIPKDLDCVIHTAGIVHSFKAKEFLTINTEATIQLAKNLISHIESPLHFIFISSLAAVGPSPKGRPHRENVLLNPISLYGKSKKVAEDWLEKNLPHNWHLTIFRPPMVIGPRDLAILDVFKMIKSGLFLYSGRLGKDKEYSFVCVHDLVNIIISALKRSGPRYSVFFTSYPKILKMHEIVEEMAKSMGVKTRDITVPLFLIKFMAFKLKILQYLLPVNPRLTPDKYHELAPDYWTCLGTKVTQELGVEYTWDLSKTVEETYLDYKNRNWL